MKRYIRIIILSIIIIFLVVFTYIKLSNNTIVDSEQLNEIMKFELKDDVYYLNDNFDSDIYSVEYRDIVSKKIKELKSKNKSLVIYNAYGTNDLSVNLYLKTKKLSYIKYTISVDDENIDDFTRTLKNKGKNNLVKEHEYQIIGLVPGYVNNIKVIVFDEKNNTISKTNYEVDLTGVKKISSRLDTYGGKDKYISDGLFTLFSKDNIYLYDNKGVVRSHIILDKYTANDILFKGNYIYYPINKNNIVKVNNLGQIKDVYYTKYDITSDYILDSNRILFISDDQIISINLKNSDVKKIVDCRELFNNDLDLVSMEYVDGDLLLSSREMSSILKVNNIDKKPVIQYILGNSSLWDKEYHKYIYSYKDNLFFGQSEISMDGDYISLLNNNYVTKENYENNKDVYDKLGIENTDEKTGTKSLFYRLKVNDNKKEYKLEESYVLPYTSSNGSLNKYKNNYIFNSSSNNTFIEYTKKFEIINSYKYSFDVSKVYKYNYKNYWFK